MNAQEAGVPSTEAESIVYDGPTPEPGVPPNLTAVSGDRQVTLSWEASSAGASAITHYEYKLSRDSSGFVSSWIDVPGDGSTRQVTVSPLVEAASYTFQMRAENTQGEGSPSPEVEAFSYDGPTLEPEAPPNLTAVSGDRQVTLSWEVSRAGASPITHYEYQYSTTSGTFNDTWTEVSGTTLIVSSLTAGTPYYFRVRAVNAQSEGPPSEASQTPYDGLTNPEAVCNDPTTTGEALPGLGTEDRPFILCSPAHLNLIGMTGTDSTYTLSAHYMMGQDIDLNNEPFTPRGDFLGTFDGRDKKITNLKISVGYSAALFIILRGSIKNLGIENFDVTGSITVGALAARSSGTITNCYAVDSDDSTDLSGGASSDNIGGLVGWQNGGTITSSYATGNFNGGNDNDNMGGLVGRQNGGTITSSYATGDPDGGSHGFDYVGGLVGWLSGGTINSSYATGNPKGGEGNHDRVGGLVGYQKGGTITSSYATGHTDGGKGSGDDMGGLVGNQNGGQHYLQLCHRKFQRGRRG